MTEKNNFSHGKVRISNDIIATIAIKAATTVKGVADVAGSQMVKHSLSETRKRAKSKLQLLIKDEFIYVDIPVILDYDIIIKEVCENIQHVIKEQVEMMTGLYVVEVNVFVEDLEIRD